MISFLMTSQSIGAVNCIIRKSSDGKLFGCNTDYVGAITAIEDALRGIICSQLFVRHSQSICLTSDMQVRYRIHAQHV